jgi:uncharacterized protein (DUF305 family)
MRAGLISLFAVAAVALTGCGSTPTAAPPPAAQSGGDHNEADVKFSLEMIPHHQQTIQIADLAAQRAGSEGAKVVAADLLGAEEKEILTMTGWLKSWNVAPPAGHGDHAMPGMLTAADVKSLEAVTGAQFDAKFLPMVKRHLENGITMAKAVIAGGRHGPTRELAGQIVKSQEKKITEVQARMT